MVSHSLEDAHKIAPRALVIDNGTIVYDGNTASLIKGEVDQSLLLGILLINLLKYSDIERSLFPYKPLSNISNT